jgi:hypothetical protein
MEDTMLNSIVRSSFPLPTLNRDNGPEQDNAPQIIPVSPDVSKPSEALPEPDSKDLLIHVNTAYARTEGIDPNYESTCQPKQEFAFLLRRERLEKIIEKFHTVEASPIPKKIKELFVEAI